MYEELYSPLPDLEPYLRRLGLAGEELKPDMDSLLRIMPAHLANIPFENLDAYGEGRTPELSVPGLFDKMIAHRRGGWCFELNGLLHALMQSLGYESYGVGVRVMLGKNPHPIIAHRGEIVILEGKKYYCDVGFGTVSIPQPVPLSGEETAAGFHAELKNGEYYIYGPLMGEMQLLLVFADHEYLPQDYVPANFFQAQNTEMPFRKRISCSIQIGDVRRQLVDFTVKEYHKGVLADTVTVADHAELEVLLKDKFGIDYKFNR